jgi:hypothetical protein
VRKIRLTGGEPLLRKNIEILIEQLAALRTPDGQPLDLTLTTNGSLLARKAQSLKDAGLQRVTVSLDGLGRCGFPQHERCGLSGGRCAGRDRGCAGGGPGADQGEHGGQAWHQRARDFADGPAFPGHGHCAALH